MKKNNGSLMSGIKKNPWIVSTIVLAVLAIALAIPMISLGNNAKSVGMTFVDFINANGGAQIELISSEDFGRDLYQVNVLADGQEIPVHVTKDGKYFVQLVAELDSDPVTQQSDQTQTAPEVVKSDKPLVQLFVMTHCPYGTQAEKGFLPAMKALGEVADLEIRFVHYYMHTNNEEEVETPRQVCIREEQSDKFIPYLECFLGTTGTPADALSCQEEVDVDAEALTECIASGRADEYYAEDSRLSEAAGVQGSPTLVVNGAIAQAGRSAQAYGDVTCSAFNNVPELCGTVSLDATNPSAGFGYATGSATTAQC